MKGYNIQFQIYADSELEAEQARRAIVAFIADLANCGRAVTGNKISEALPRWKDDVFVRNRILNFFKPNKKQ